MSDLIKRILITMICVSVYFTTAVGISFYFSGCKTQASMKEGEPYACYASRYLARESLNSDSMVNECSNSIKRDWCIKILKDNPEIFKDFNDCWRTGK